MALARPPPGVALGDRAKLRHRGAVVELVFLPSGGKWPRVLEAEELPDPEARLEEVIRAPLHPHEALGAYHHLAAKLGGRPDDYRATLELRAEFAKEAGFPSEEVATWTALAHAQYRGYRLREARESLALAEAALGDIPDEQARARIALISAYVDGASARYRRAAEALERGQRAAARHGDELLSLYFGKMVAVMASDLGQHDEALRRFDALEGAYSKLPGPMLLEFLLDRAYLAARKVADGGEEGWRRVRDLTRAAVELAATLENPRRLADARLNLAWALGRLGEIEAARAELEAYRDSGAAPSTDDFAALVEAQLLLSSSPRAALERFDALRRVSGELAFEVGWQAEHGRGQALARLQDVEGAKQAFLRGLELLESTSMWTDLRTERAPYVDARRSAYHDAIEAMVSAGDFPQALVFDAWRGSALHRPLELAARVGELGPEDEARWHAARAAFEAATEQLSERAEERAGRARSELVSFDAETKELEGEALAAWRRAANVLDEAGARSPPPARRWAELGAHLADDEALVVFTRVNGGPFVFRATAQGVVGGALPGAAKLVEPGPGISHVYLVPGGDDDLDRVVEVWLPRVLGKATSSVLPNANLLARPASPAAGQAIVVGDPDRNLPWARAEAEWVASRLEVTPQLGSSVAKTDLLAGLGTASVFHFSGHGRLAPEDPLRAELDLGEASLRLEDILATSAVPRLVVLSGCETGRRTPSSRGPALGLADGFLLAGSHVVVATVEPMDDLLGSRFVRRFYEARGAERPIAAFRETFLKSEKKERQGFYIGGRRL